MLSYTFINSHSQVSNPGPDGPIVVVLLWKSLSNTVWIEIRQQSDLGITVCMQILSKTGV